MTAPVDYLLFYFRWFQHFHRRAEAQHDRGRPQHVGVHHRHEDRSIGLLFDRFPPRSIILRQLLELRLEAQPHRDQ
jgi:hypothetical protein